MLCYVMWGSNMVLAKVETLSVCVQSLFVISDDYERPL